jgi:hypothetical protein
MNSGEILRLVYDMSFDSPLIGNFACDGPVS